MKGFKFTFLCFIIHNCHVQPKVATTGTVFVKNIGKTHYFASKMGKLATFLLVTKKCNFGLLLLLFSLFLLALPTVGISKV